MRRTHWATLGIILAAISSASCADRPTGPGPTPTAVAGSRSESPPPSTVTPELVRQLAAARGIVPLPAPPYVRRPLVRLGQALLFDRVLSGNRDIACSTCHLPAFATGDGKSLSVGQGGSGFGPNRSHPNGVFIPRNAPPLFNLGAMQHLFWDGRVQVGAQGRIVTPAGPQITPTMARVFEFGAASALAMFPVTNRAEMRAGSGNELAQIPDTDLPEIWAALMRRLGGIREYREMFEEAYPGTLFRDMTFAHASNAIGGFMVDQLTFSNSPWDRFIEGRDQALTPQQLEGAQTFLTLKCSLCHNGATFSDEQFHNVAVAQFGPGQGNGASLLDDFGRMNVTGDAADQYRFRTTPLRNVELTGPYGHDGAIFSLRGFVEHYSESDKKLLAFDPAGLEPALRDKLLPNAAAILAQRDTLLNGVVLTADLVDKLVVYMQALTDDRARNLGHLVPGRVPSGLPVDRLR
ncbi:MAG: cytochrome c peroxidase [Gemmatimonadaceae bacterium]